jgi:hypothetical protein
VYLLVSHAHINEIHGSRSKIPSKKSRPYIYILKFLALLGAPYIYIYDISRLRVKVRVGKFYEIRTDFCYNGVCYFDCIHKYLQQTTHELGDIHVF